MGREAPNLPRWHSLGPRCPQTHLFHPGTLCPAPCPPCATWSRTRAVSSCKLDLTLVPTGPSLGRSLSLLLAGAWLVPVPSRAPQSPPASTRAGAESCSRCTLLCRTLAVCSRLCYRDKGSLNGTVSFSTAWLGVGFPCAAWLEVGVVLHRTPKPTSVGASHGTFLSLGCARWGKIPVLGATGS